jgi:hypothetical protein
MKTKTYISPVEYGRLLDENTKLLRRISKMETEDSLKEKEIMMLTKIVKRFDMGRV